MLCIDFSIGKIDESITIAGYYRLTVDIPCPFPCLPGYLPSVSTLTSVPMDEIKYRFIKDLLTNEGERLIKNQGIAIKSALKEHTGALLRERKFLLNGKADEMNLEFEHPAYLRFLDIRNKNRKRKKNQSKRSTKKDIRIYNRFVIGHYHGIAERMMYGFTAEVRQYILDTWKGGVNG
ncbi:hypothetical protein [Sphingobacterium multivorum]|uniref:hypothetical protein n=1 Tax=Sphingobacterium multivorum TaxID=28454 RepID=UPI003DA516A8